MHSSYSASFGGKAKLPANDESAGRKWDAFTSKMNDRKNKKDKNNPCPLISFVSALHQPGMPNRCAALLSAVTWCSTGLPWVRRHDAGGTRETPPKRCECTVRAYHGVLQRQRGVLLLRGLRDGERPRGSYRRGGRRAIRRNPCRGD